MIPDVCTGDINWAYMSSAKGDTCRRCLELHDESKAGVALGERFEQQQQQEKIEAQKMAAKSRQIQEAKPIAEEKEMVDRVFAARKEVTVLLHQPCAFDN